MRDLRLRRPQLLGEGRVCRVGGEQGMSCWGRAGYVVLGESRVCRGGGGGGGYMLWVCHMVYTHFDNNFIMPGTSFMDNLSVCLQ